MSKPVIILVSPQMGENIGAAARSMKNFSLEDLRIVNLRDGWPNPKASAMAVGAVDIIEQAKIYSNLQNAIADLGCIYATTAQARNMNKDYVELRDLKIDLLTKTNIGILFGR